MNHPVTILRTAGLLRVWLTVYQAVFVILGGLGGLALLVGGVILLVSPGVGAWTRTPGLDLPGFEWRWFGLLLVLLGLLYLTGVVVYLVLTNWAKEWEGQVARLSTSQGGNPARVAELSRTLGKWITASQWAPVVVTALLLVGVLAGAALLAPLLSAGEDNADTAYVAPLLGGLYAIGIVVSGGSQAVVGWLVLAAIRRFMTTTTERLRGVGVALTPSANVVGTWFIVLMVLVGIGGFFLLMYIPVLLLGGLGTSQGSADTAGLAGALVGGGVSVVFSLALYALLFLLLLWSRGFALAVAGQLDSGLTPSQPVAPLPEIQPDTEYGQSPLH